MYGFVCDPSLSLLHNVSNVICDMPAWLYYSRPSNIAFHNLCLPSFPLPAGLKSLLGLGLSFCPRPPMTNNKSAVQLKRFYRDCNTRMFFGGSPNADDDTGLFVRSDWEPDSEEIPIEFRARVSYFIKRVGALFKRRRRVQSSLLPSQMAAFKWLEAHDNVVVFPTDKNLGPAVMERDRYIDQALTDHLLDPKTYRRLDKTTADRRVTSITIILNNMIRELNAAGRHSDAKFLQRSLKQVKDPFPYFYLLAKVHKTPLKTRPIVSVSGSLLHGLGRWVDVCLQSICKNFPYRCTSSVELVSDLKQLGNLPPTARLFTCDATSMYTNIDTRHALTTIDEYLTAFPSLLRKAGVPHALFMRGLKTIMIHNVFRFGDTYWSQLTGTAMGAPPAPMYATLYFGILEQRFLPHFPECLFYRRYIDDGFGIWDTQGDPSHNAESWEIFKSSFDSVSLSTLQWTFSPLRLAVDFLDLTITCADDGSIGTRLYEKALNLYLYLPQHSCHPPGVLKSLIHGMMLRCFRLSSSADTAQADVKRLLVRLVARGYSPTLVNTLMRQAFASLNFARQALAPSTAPTSTKASALFLHVPYHPRDPSSREIQRLFVDILARPAGEPPLSALWNRHGYAFGDTRLIVAYSRPRNLGNYFSPRKLRPPGVDPSVSLQRHDEAVGASNPDP